ncbi:PhzF family phenazine biosynthesis protein [Pseudoxanthomonas sp. UTMC 1351]|uniref:PhzF family phenazine biosynthesis protein n=1 Tax=Pseudoxanthomonas sp. UTMC 1351 TaxID=2695853 RepID=UPI0034CE33F9
MTSHPYLQLDVFADRPGAGNPLGVVFDAGDLDTATMQAYAAWANLSEIVFFLPPTTAEADYRVRIFTPLRELPFAGHPSVGAAWAALDAGLVRGKQQLIQECAAGLLPVRVDDTGPQRKIHIRAPRAQEVAGSQHYRPEIEAAFAGIPRGALAPALWDNGPHWWLVELANAGTVRGFTPDYARIGTITAPSDAVGLAVFAMANAKDHQLTLRVFCPGDAVPEDPVTGSANACIAAALLQAGRLPGTGRHYVASQGRELGRDGKIEIAIDDADNVWIGGQVQPIIRGSVNC